MRWLSVKGWREFQHYSNRSPPWIKLHRAILDDYEFAELADNQKAHLMLIWVLASQNDGRVPDNARWIESRTNCRGIDLQVFVDAGFLVEAGVDN